MNMPQFVNAGPSLWEWGDWYIAQAYGKYWLLVSSGIEYGPFLHFGDALNYAGEVAC